MAEFMPFIKLPSLEVPRREYYSHALKYLTMQMDRLEYLQNTFTDRYHFLIDEVNFSNTYQPVSGETIPADRLLVLNNALSGLKQDLNTVYALAESTLTYFKKGDLLPNSITALENTLLIQPTDNARNKWTKVHPLYWFFIDEYYFYNLDFSDVAFKNLIVAQLKTELGFQRNFDTLKEYAEKHNDESIKSILNADPRQYDNFAEKAFSLFLAQEISLNLAGSEPIAKINYDTPYDPNTATTPPPKRRLSIIFSSESHRRLSVWDSQSPKQPELPLIAHFFEHRQRIKNDSAIIAGHPMTGLILACNYLAQQGITPTSPDFQAQVLRTANDFIAGARVDFMDPYNADINKTEKFSKDNIYLCVDYLEPVLKVQSQLTSKEQEAANQKNINLNPDITRFPYYSGLTFPEYGTSQLTIFNPEQKSLYISVEGNSDNINLIEITFEVKTLTTVNAEIKLRVKSLIQNNGEAKIVLRLNDPGGVILKNIAVDIQTPKFIPVRFNEIIRAAGDQGEVPVPDIEQRALDVIQALNHAFGRQINFFIYPKTTYSKVQSDLGNYAIPYDISGHTNGNIIRKIRLLQDVIDDIKISSIKDEEWVPDYDISKESDVSKTIKTFTKLKDITSDLNFIWYSTTGMLIGGVNRDPFLPDQIVILSPKNILLFTDTSFAQPLHEMTHALGRVIFSDDDEKIDYFKHPSDLMTNEEPFFDRINMGSRVTMYNYNPLAGENEKFIRLDNQQIKLLREHYRELE